MDIDSSNDEPQKKRRAKRPLGIVSFTSYFRKKKQREAEEKAEKARLLKERLNAIIQPAQFSPEDEQRLRELRMHKNWKKIQEDQQNRHSQAQKSSLPSIPETGPVLSIVTDRAMDDLPTIDLPGARNTFIKRSIETLHQHRWERRIAVVGSLLVLLFVSLHADALGQKLLPPIFFLDNQYVPWYVIVLKDGGKFCHMSVCSLIHFALCDISLIYAFESMEVCRSTGPSVKKFYQEKVHLLVAALSGGIVALSICKAILLAWYRMLRDLVEMMVAAGKDSFHNAASVVPILCNLPNTCSLGLEKTWAVIVCTGAVVKTAASPSKWLSTLYATTVRVLTGIFVWLMTMVIPFRGDREGIMKSSTDKEEFVLDFALLNNTLALTTPLQDEANVTLQQMANTTNVATIAQEFFMTNSRALNTTNGKQRMHWMDDAFETCRSLLTHSAVFLAVLLLAFNFLAKSYRHGKADSNGKDRADTSVALSSVRTSETLAHNEQQPTDASMESTNTVAETVSTTRRTPMIINLPLSKESLNGGRKSRKGTSNGIRGSFCFRR